MKTKIKLPLSGVRTELNSFKIENQSMNPNVQDEMLDAHCELKDGEVELQYVIGGDGEIKITGEAEITLDLYFTEENEYFQTRKVKASVQIEYAKTPGKIGIYPVPVVIFGMIDEIKDDVKLFIKFEQI